MPDSVTVSSYRDSYTNQIVSTLLMEYGHTYLLLYVYVHTHTHTHTHTAQKLASVVYQQALIHT